MRLVLITRCQNKRGEFFFSSFSKRIEVMFRFFFFVSVFVFSAIVFFPFLKNCFVLTKVRLKRFDEHTHKKKKLEDIVVRYFIER